MHDRLLALGFADPCAALRLSWQDRLFPDSMSNGFGTRTQDASKRANRCIDAIVSRDPGLVFPIFRHGLNDLATEAEIQDRVIDRICGHKPTTPTGSGTLSSRDRPAQRMARWMRRGYAMALPGRFILGSTTTKAADCIESAAFRQACTRYVVLILVISAPSVRRY